ncbi:MAG: nucleotidyltransferase domain-containing protein [Anaerolineae bacterium]|nr:nucleotidyltransferase domain-containing protein [Anaerolineae bacterium]
MRSEAPFQPTAYPDVNAVLYQVYAGARTILGDQFVGMYLYGSLATQTFDPDSSDIDFLIVTTEEIRGEKLDALVAMHARIGTGKTKWAIQLEGAYIPRDALRRYDPTCASHPHLDRDGAILAVVEFHTDWV